MKKYTIDEVAKLLANKTHSVYCNVNEFELLRKGLKLSFPKDEETDDFEFDFKHYYGYCKHNSDNWANVGTYLEELEIINLSDIVDLHLNIESVTISKEDYDRFLKLESKVKKSNQNFLDKCAIEAMNGIVNDSELRKLFAKKGDVSNTDWMTIMSQNAYFIANEMLTERNKNK